jgi:leucyl aminopeptidase
LIYSVGKAAESSPKIIVMEYYGFSVNKPITHAILGKGVTFDTGGLNLKPGSSMDTMYYDKHGACNTIAIFNSVVRLNLKINCVFVIGLAENSVDSVSYRPSDILMSKKGLTVEVGNTDAEGRLVLADCLTHIQDNYKPKVIIDLATLTGACMVGLGSHTAGLFSNDDNLANSLLNVSKYDFIFVIIFKICNLIKNIFLLVM